MIQSHTFRHAVAASASPHSHLLKHTHGKPAECVYLRVSVGFHLQLLNVKTHLHKFPKKRLTKLHIFVTFTVRVCVCWSMDDASIEVKILCVVLCTELRICSFLYLLSGLLSPDTATVLPVNPNTDSSDSVG